MKIILVNPPANPDVCRSRYDSPSYRPGYNSQVSEPAGGRDRERGGWGEERFHSLDSRHRHRYNQQPCSESDSEWADDRDGWSDRSVVVVV